MTGSEKAITEAEALANPEKVGEQVCIINGGIEGAELGIYLASLGKTVTIVEETSQLCGGNSRNLRDVQYRMVVSGLDARCNAKVFEINDRGVDCEGGFIEADTIVLKTNLK